MVNTTENSLVTIKEKIKNFFKRMSNDRDSSVSGKGTYDSDKHLYRDDLKMY